MNSYFPTGSEWRKWDLQVHTPESIVNYYSGSDPWPKFIEEIESLDPEFKVIGICDYIFLDGYKRILKEKKNGRLKNIELFLPVIELRIDKFGGTQGNLSKLNYHVIFSDELEPEIIEQQFINVLPRSYQLSPNMNRQLWNAVATRQSLEELGKLIRETTPVDKRADYDNINNLTLGFNNLCVSLEAVKEALKSHCFSNKALTAVGRTEWADIKWNDQSVAEKKNIINEANLVFGSYETQDDWQKARDILSKSGVNDILIDCSDAHAFKESQNKDRIGKCYTWIKADPTFKGLLQVLTAPDERIYVGDIPPQVQRVRNNSTKYMKSVSIRRKPEARIDETWFDNSIPLNSGMICIIGNKGSGKSALTDIIGLLGNTKQYENFTFLSKKTFRQPKDNKSRHFQATMEWESGFTFTKGLDEQIDTNQPELIKYLPQNYLEYICNQIGKIEETEFDKELKNIIFSHIDESNRLGMSSLEELIKFKTSQAEGKRFNLRKELHEINSKIVALEEMSQPEYKIKLINLLAKQKEELDAHDRSKPLEVKRPENDPEKQAYMQNITNQIEKSNVELNICKLDFDNKKHHSSQLNILISQADILIGRLENISTQVEGFINESKDDFAGLGVSLDSVLSFSINVEPLKTKKDSLVKEKKQIDESLDPQRPGGLGDKILKIERMIKELQYKLDQPNRLYQQYKTDLMNWESKRNSILGNEETPDTLKYYEKKIRDLESIPGKLQEARGNRKAKTMAIYSVILGLKETYKELYLPVVRFMGTDRSIKENAALSFEVSVVNAGFEEKFFNIINRHAIGTFYGLEEGHQKLSELLSSHDFDTEQGLEFFLNNIIYAIEHDIREGKKEIRVKDQLRKGQTVEMLYDLIFSLEYLRPRYSLRMADKELSQLSPGERGTLLLLFYLLVDKDDRPLVIDQPEENLDNQTVYEQLVNSIKKAKKRRQIIFVTHNPNIAVVCDAEQIIHAHLDKKNNFKMNYTSGSLENPIINKAVLDILEGTRPAFKKRDEKYF